MERKQKKAIRDSLGLTDLSEDAMLRARELFSIAFKTDPGLDQKEFINDVLTEDIRKATGGVNVNDLKAEIMKTRAMDIIDLYGEKDPETMGRAKVTMITKEQLDSMSKNYQDLHKKLIAMPKIMQDGELNLDVLNNNITTFSKENKQLFVIINEIMIWLFKLILLIMQQRKLVMLYSEL